MKKNFVNRAMSAIWKQLTQKEAIVQVWSKDDLPIFVIVPYNFNGTREKRMSFERKLDDVLNAIASTVFSTDMISYDGWNNKKLASSVYERLISRMNGMGNFSIEREDILVQLPIFV